MAYKRQSPEPVVEGGTGIQTATAYAVICAGTTATGAFQNVSGLGTAGQVLTSNGAANLPTWQSNSACFPAYANVNTSPYVVGASDQFLSVDCSGGAITVQLPNSPTSSRIFWIKDRTGSAPTHNITVTTVGGAVNIDGAVTYTMNTAYQSINIIFNGTSYEIF